MLLERVGQTATQPGRIRSELRLDVDLQFASVDQKLSFSVNSLLRQAKFIWENKISLSVRAEFLLKDVVFIQSCLHILSIGFQEGCASKTTQYP